jgi:hypothetical protein
MSYVSSVLQPGEQVVQIGRVHWIVYLRPLFFAAICVLLLRYSLGLPSSDVSGFQIAAAIFALFSIVSFLRAWFNNWTTELAITNRRVIYKRGFGRRRPAQRTA